MTKRGYKAVRVKGATTTRSHKTFVNKTKLAVARAGVVVLANREGEPEPLGDVAGGCRWLAGDPRERGFCGHKTAYGSRWCKHHHWHVHNPPEKPVPDSDMLKAPMEGDAGPRLRRRRAA